MRTSRLILKVDGSDYLMQFTRRITYIEAVGELDGMTANLQLPWNEKKALKLNPKWQTVQ